MNKLSLIKGATKTLGGAKCAAKPRYFSNGLVNQGRGRGLKNFDDFFDHSWSDWNSLFNEVEKNLPTLKSQQGWKPRSDIQETDSEFEIHAELPGVAKEDIKVSVEKGVLTLSGEKKSSIDETDQSKQFHRKERFHGTFVRRFTLPEETDPKQIKANFKDGVLSITVPKTPEVKPETHDIQIDA